MSVAMTKMTAGTDILAGESVCLTTAGFAVSKIDGATIIGCAFHSAKQGQIVQILTEYYGYVKGTLITVDDVEEGVIRGTASSDIKNGWYVSVSNGTIKPVDLGETIIGVALTNTKAGEEVLVRVNTPKITKPHLKVKKPAQIYMMNEEHEVKIKPVRKKKIKMVRVKQNDDDTVPIEV